MKTLPPKIPSPLCPLCNTDTQNTSITNSVVTPRFMDKPYGSAAGTMELPHGRRTNHGKIGQPPCYRRSRGG